MSRKVLFSLVLALVLVLCAGTALAWDPDNGNYDINNLADLKAFRDVAKNTPNVVKGKTVELKADIDLKNEAWEPISGFGGTFNGNNFTISNLKIDKGDAANVGFFSGAKLAVTNVKFHNAEVKGGSCTGVVSGGWGDATSMFKNIQVTGLIKVSSSGANDYSGKSYARAGVITGGWAYGSYINCVVIGDDGSFVKYTGTGDGRYCAGIVGHADDVSKYENCWVENIEISGGWLCGGLTGAGPASSAVSGCIVKDVTVNSDYSGGLFGWFFDAGSGSVEDCAVENLTMPQTSGSGVFGGYSDSIGVDMSSNYSIGNPDLPNSSQAAAAKTASVAITIESDDNSYNPQRKYFDSITEAVEELGNDGGEITIFDDQVLSGELPSNITIEAKNDAVIITPPAAGYIMTYPGSETPHTGVTFTGSNLGFRSQVPLYFNDESTFVGVSIYKDGKRYANQPVYDVDYIVTEGSTVVTLSSDYLNKLESGTYTIAVASNLDGKDIVVDSTFTIPVVELKNRAPQTGDNSNIALWISLMAISALSFVALGRKSRFN